MPKAKEKRNWKHIHKIRIHDNRWLMWTISLSILICATVIAYIQVSGINFEIQMGYDRTPPSGYSVFSNNSEGYNLKYPKKWSVESEGDSRMSFVDDIDPNQYFSVITYPAVEERQVRTALAASGKEQGVLIAGLPASLYVQNIDTTEKVALIKEDNTVYVLRGKGNSFDWIVNSFRLNQEIE